MNVEKRAIRHALRGQRRCLSAAFVETASAAVWARLRACAAYQSAVSVAAYVTHENEISTTEVLADVAGSGRRLYLPHHTDGGRLVRWRPDDPLVIGRGGVREPSAAVVEPIDTPAVVLLPVVAWDAHGTRVGRGGGFYDRILASLDAAFVAVGLAYEFQECPKLPREPWDIPLHYVITERRMVRCGYAEGAGARPLEKGGMQQ